MSPMALRPISSSVLLARIGAPPVRIASRKRMKSPAVPLMPAPADGKEPGSNMRSGANEIAPGPNATRWCSPIFTGSGDPSP